MKWYAAFGLIGSLALLGGLALAADAPKDDPAKADTDKFTGTWSIVSLEVDGKKESDDQLKSMKVVFEPGKYTFTKDGNTVETGTYKLDPSQKPKAIESTPADGKDKGKIFLGIYELDGDNNKVCFGIPGTDRPTDFTTKKDSNRILYVLKRDKP